MRLIFVCLLVSILPLCYAQLLPVSIETEKAEVEARRISEAQKIKSFDREMTEQAAKKAKEMYLKSLKEEN